MREKKKGSFFSLIKIFVLSFLILFLFRKKENFLVVFLINKVNIENSFILDATLSLIITFLAEMMILLISYIFSKIDISISTFINNIERNEVTFRVNDNNEYVQEVLNLKVLITSYSKLNTRIIKYLGLSLKIYFNPEILDVSFTDTWDNICEKKDCKDESHNHDSFSLKGRNININLLNDINVNGKLFGKKPFSKERRITIRPIRVKREKTSIDYEFIATNNNCITKLIADKLTSINCESFTINCEEDK